VNKPFSSSSSVASGRLVSDERGHSQWHWQTAPGKFSSEASADWLEAQIAGLSLVDEVNDKREPKGHCWPERSSVARGR